MYDDSGRFYTQLTDDSDTNFRCFCYETPFKKLKENLNKNPSKFFLGICEHERVYLEYSKHRFHLMNYIARLHDEIKKYYGNLLDDKKITKMQRCLHVHFKCKGAHLFGF